MKKNISYSVVLILLMILIATAVISVSLGSSDIGISDVYRLICSKIPIVKNYVDVSGIASTYSTIIFKVRMPRLLLAAFVGAALSMSGCAYQGVFRNPLSDPYILGISSGAALFATIAVVSGISVNFLGLGSISIFAFVGAILTVAVVYYVSRIGGGVSLVNMLLTGTAISTMLSAIISLILLFNHDQMTKIYLWTMGSFTSASFRKVIFLCLFVIVCGTVLIAFSRKLNILNLGEEEAMSLGINTKRLRIIVVVTASLLVAASVSVSGIIGFVGLIIPHSVRMIFGSDNVKIMTYGAIIGAIFLMVCDTIARVVLAPTEIPIGIITAIFGAPYFIFLVFVRKNKG